MIHLIEFGSVMNNTEEKPQLVRDFILLHLYLPGLLVGGLLTITAISFKAGPLFFFGALGVLIAVISGLIHIAIKNYKKSNKW